MKAINWILTILIIIIPVFLIFHFTMLIRDYVIDTEIWSYYLIFSSILITYIMLQFTLYGKNFNNWFDSKIK
jgi:hypothetical protein